MVDFIDEENEEVLDSEITPTLTDVIKAAMEAVSTEMRVCVPAKVIRYDFKKQLVDAQPYLKSKYLDGEAPDPPIIYNVPLAIPRAGDAFISLPLKKDQNVLLIFSDQSLEKWLSSGKILDPQDARRHHISDAIAIPGCYPFSTPASVSNGDDIILKNSGAEIRIKPNGHFQFLNGGNELLRIIDEYMAADIATKGTSDASGMTIAKLKLRALLES